MARKTFYTFLFIGIIASACFWIWDNNPEFADNVRQYVDKGDHLTLEVQYTPEQIMDAHRHELLSDGRHTFQEPKLKYHPYLLIDGKYTTPSGKSKDGTVLWSMVDGEMVTNTDTWDKSHGFQDALLVNATPNEFKVINTLAKNGGSMTTEQLQNSLELDQEIISPWVDSARSKHLVIQKGDLLSLHFQNPVIPDVPQTKINQWLVTKLYNHTQRIPKRFTRKQIEKIAKAAYGDTYDIKSMQEVALPVYSIEVLNPDGSVHTSFWNGLNGQRINPRSFAY